jgi:hypothetical protein
MEPSSQQPKDNPPSAHTGSQESPTRTKNGFFKGIIHNIFGIKEEGAGKLKVFMVNCFPYLDTEAAHFVGSLDVFGPIHNDQDHLRLLTILHQEHRSHRHPAVNCEEAPDDEEHTPTSPA